MPAATSKPPTKRDASALFPAAKHVVLADGIEVDVRVLSTGQTVKIAALLAPMISEIKSLNDLRELTLRHGEDFAKAIAIAIGWTEDEVLALPLQLFVRVVDEVVTMNFDFFVTDVAPMLERIFTGPAKREPAESEG
jgi:hypothetical protein